MGGKGMNKRERDDFYDKCYDAWRDGKNPDMVNDEKYERKIDQGYYPDEFSYKDIYGY